MSDQEKLALIDTLNSINWYMKRGKKKIPNSELRQRAHVIRVLLAREGVKV